MLARNIPEFRGFLNSNQQIHESTNKQKSWLAIFFDKAPSNLRISFKVMDVFPAFHAFNMPFDLYCNLFIRYFEDEKIFPREF